ncbi:hydrogenase iron-sulfur subunit [Desulfobacula sp.]|uniref:hydrogenase iron-sulfur subunit n=1 Tax=Desulfobacula sp. TaxID=2593537 RepID=UPI0025BE6FFB|nr:hydrogenase iron-sulfur subunit [Desulfobacula sp.]MBC2702967.1 hydrogenase iron-sulfur subunit [Desulfobacula sp.]
MKKTTPNILILGGGVAGMAAAQTFSDQDVAVHLVERESALGGHAAMWACMATDTCQNCGACLSIEMADQVQKQENVISHLDTIVETINKAKQGYKVILENKETFNVEKIIMATGFSLFNPVQINSLHYDEYKNVITTAELNTILQKETLSGYFNGKPDPKIAFIQCVGSRNREQGKDFCSQVCCKISMRHANKLTHLFPESDITLFYMDLQIIGKEVRPLFKTLSKNIALVQGVPAEILEDTETNMLTIVAEDKETQSRVSKAFDLIVLSVGMQPSPTLETTAGILGLKPNSWGFFNTDQAVLAEDVIIAGCANGPKDILSSKQDGRIAAAKVIEDLGLNTNNKLNIAVFGQGTQADQAAEIISSKGYSTYLFGPGTSLSKDTPVTFLNESNIISISGTAGNFSLYYESGNEKKYLTCAAIIAAFEPEQSLNRLENISNEFLSLDAFSQMIEKKPDTCPDNSVILLDYFGPEFKSFARLALKTSVKAKALGKNISIIMNKTLVHGALGQRLYDTARQQGVDFFRFETREDLKFEDSGNGFLIKLRETTLPSIELSLNCDCLVLPPSLTPAEGFKDAAALLRLPLDREGFLQSANTRHRLTRSSRKGIFFAGTCHDEIDKNDLDNEINDILSALSTESFELPDVDTGVEINQGMCAQCLTCIRVCPHSAIVMNKKNRPQIVANACFSCHLCVSNCPAYAIESKELTNDQIAQKVEKDKMVILACERSAALAAGSLTLPDHITLIPIPCACRISSDVILKALLNGASKVIISGCHEENCRSMEGSNIADASVRQVLSIPGMDASKVAWEPIAANETKKFERIISKARG